MGSAQEPEPRPPRRIVAEHPNIKHPQADPNCDDCRGNGWRISHRSKDGKLAVERCDACMVPWRKPAFAQDEDVVPLAQAAGFLCSETYPCYLLCPECRKHLYGNCRDAEYAKCGNNHSFRLSGGKLVLIPKRK